MLAGVAVVAQHDAVEPHVVLAGQPRGAVGVLPAPLAESLLQRVGLLLRGGGLGRVQHALGALADVDLVGHADGPLLHHRLGDRQRVHPAGAPLAGRLDRVGPAFDRPDRGAGMLDHDARVIQQLSEELLVGLSVDPRGAEPRLDLLRPEIGGQHPLERLHVHLRAPGRAPAASRAASSLCANVAGEVLGGGHQLAGGGVLVDELAELLRAPRRLGAEQPGDLVDARRGRGCRGRSRARPAACRRRAAARAAARPARSRSRPARRCG